MDKYKTQYLFDHVPKTAGSSLYVAFESLLGSSNISPPLRMSHHRACSDYRDSTMIRGHFWFVPGEKLDPARYYITILRDPIDRAVSNFFFLREQQGIGGYAETAANKANDINEYVFSDDPAVLQVISNHQTRHYMQMDWDGSSEISEKEQLELAKRALERYDLVGVYEYLEDVVDVICYECGLRPVVELPRLNVTATRPPSRRLDPLVLERLEALNSADRELHRFATGLFLKRRREIMIECINSRVAAGSLSSEKEITDAETSQPAERKESPAAPNDIGPSRRSSEFGTRGMELAEVLVFGEFSKTNLVWGGETVTVRILFYAHEECDQLTVGFAIRDLAGRLVYGTNTLHLMHWLKIVSQGAYYVDYTFRNVLSYGDYSVQASLHRGTDHLSRCYHWKEDAARFSVVGNLDYSFVGVANLAASVSFGVYGGEGGIESVGTMFEGVRALRITTDTPALTEFRAKIEALNVIESLSPLEVVAVHVEVTNDSSVTWPVTGRSPVNLSYHWRDEEGAIMVHDGLRTPLPHDVRPGETVRSVATVKAPATEGTAFLEFSLVQEGVAWFYECDVTPETIRVAIENR